MTDETIIEALESCESWIERWTEHVGSCPGGYQCTCGRTAVLSEARAALAAAAKVKASDATSSLPLTEDSAK